MEGSGIWVGLWEWSGLWEGLVLGGAVLGEGPLVLSSHRCLRFIKVHQVDS